jgi:tripartite-type tricarboxylate transporter receptor subunit TctC
MKRSILIGFALLFVLGLSGFVAKSDAADKYPAKPIIFLVPNEAGSSADMAARALAEKLQAQLGQPVVVTNKPGAGSTIGHRELHNAKPDGYTLGLSTATIFMNKLQGCCPMTTTITRFWGPISTGRRPSCLHETKRPFNTMQEVIAAAKAKPAT